MREKRFTLSRSQREELWRRVKQTDDLALTRSSTNATFAEEPLSEQRIGGLRRLVDADDRGLNTPLKSVERAALLLALARQPLWWGAGVRCWMPRRWRGGLGGDGLGSGVGAAAHPRSRLLAGSLRMRHRSIHMSRNDLVPQLASRSRQHWSAPRHSLLQSALRRPAEGRTPPVRGVRVRYPRR